MKLAGCTQNKRKTVIEIQTRKKNYVQKLRVNIQFSRFFLNRNDGYLQWNERTNKNDQIVTNHKQLLKVAVARFKKAADKVIE
jgi:hypothetical protein